MVRSDINMRNEECIDIHEGTNSVWLGRGTGFWWRRSMHAFEGVSKQRKKGGTELSIIVRISLSVSTLPTKREE